MMGTDRKSKKLSKEEFLRKVTSGHLSTERAVAHLTGQLHHYEKKYNMRSEVFYQLIVGTPAEDQPDFLAGAMCYRSYFRTLEANFSLASLASFWRLRTYSVPIK